VFKRVRWMGMGAVAGLGASAWAQWRLHRVLEEHPSIRTGAGIVASARRAGREVGDALADGRQAMLEREAALRAQLDAGRQAAGRPGELTAGRRGDDAARPQPQLRVVDATASPSHDGPGPGRAGAKGSGAGDGGPHRAQRRRPGA
jgi:hypothetical protein